MPSPPKAPSARPLKPAKEGQSSKAPSARKKTSNARISAACEACKKRKTKCTGGPAPCQLCETLGTECVIDLSLDMRRRAAFQRTIDESRNYQDALNALLDGIRDGPSPRLEGLFDYVRSGATNQDIAVAVQHHLSRTEDEDGDETMLSPADGIDPLLDDCKPIKSPAEMSSLESLPSESGKVKMEDLGPIPISTLLFSLKNCSQPQGEALLQRFLTLKLGEKVILPPWSPEGRSPWEGAGPGINPPSVAERAMWHPVLHVRSQSTRTDERPQVWPVPHSCLRSRDISVASLDGPVHICAILLLLARKIRTEDLTNDQQFGRFEPPSRRFSETAPHTEHPQSMSDSPSPVRAPSRQSPRNPLINTDVSLNAMSSASSPSTPYFEPITNFPSGQPRQNEWDVCVAQEDQVTRLRIPRHLVLPLVIPDDSPMSRTYTDYLFGARRMLESGVSAGDILGHSERVSVDLFFRPRRTNDKFDCASWACEVSRSYDTNIFVRLATACLLTHMMRVS